MWVAALYLSCAIAAAEPQIQPGIELHYRGTVARVERDRSTQAAGKAFDLSLLVTADGPHGTDYYWLLDERGQGTFGWAERFGKWSQNAAGQVPEIEGPALLYDYGKGKHVVALPAPRMVLGEASDNDARKKPEIGAKWTADERDFEILRTQSVDGRTAWVVEVRNQFGVQRRVWVDQESGIVLQEEDRVFMDQGTEYRLALELADVEFLEPASLAARQASYTALVQLHAKLKRAPRTTDEKLTPAQLKVLAANLPAARTAVEGPATRLLAAAERDLKQQESRTSALDKVTAEQVGRKPTAFEIAGLDGATLRGEELSGAVTVLHFWDYRDEPLKEPYGQVGYLEFLYDKHKDKGLRLFGVAVDGRFQQPAGAKGAAVGVRKLKNFMNLSYPILFDGGELVREFGDPRLQGGELPLFVVVGPEGKIVHYKVGHYPVDREAGLKQLDAVVTGLLAAEEKEEAKK